MPLLYPRDANVGLSASIDRKAAMAEREGPFQLGFNGFFTGGQRPSWFVASEKQLQRSLLHEELFSLCLPLICSSGHDIHQPFQPACLLKARTRSLNHCRLFSWLLSYAKYPSQGEEKTVLQLRATLNGPQLPDDCLQNVAPAFLLLFSTTVICTGASLFASFHYSMAPYCLFAELPYGWEEIDDPQYGTYYVE